MVSNNTKIVMTIGVVFALFNITLLPTVGISNIDDFPTLKNMTDTSGVGNILYVGGTGSNNYTRIQDAIDGASDGDTVFVYDDSSPYYENVVIYKSINLMGDNKTNTVIDGGKNGDVVYVSANVVRIEEFTIQNSRWDKVGICVISDYNIISNNIITNNSDGVWLWKSSNNTISGNTISNNRYGIHLEQQSNNNYIIGNNISNNRGHGICLSDNSDNSDDNVIDANAINSNGGCGILFSIGISNSNITGNFIRNNNEEAIYLHTKSCSNIISGNIIEDNKGMGILLDLWCSSNIISENVIRNNNLKHHNDVGGIGIGTSNNNVISGNDIRGNKGEEIYLFKSKGNTIINNNIIDYGSITDHTKIAFFEFSVQESFMDLLNILKNSFTNKFIRNYWNRPRALPRPIMGEIHYYYTRYNKITFPWAIFDWFPALKPYKIYTGLTSSPAS